MKYLYAILALALGVRGDDGFQRWLDKHGANTRSTATLDVRRANFLSNQKLVDEHNAAADAGEHSFWLTTDGPLADLSLDEYRATLLSFGGGGIAGAAAAPAASAAPPPPDAFDWRDVPHVVGKVKNQLACGSCWAFSAVATMEGAWNYKTNSSNVFSEQQILDCEIGPKACDGGFIREDDGPCARREERRRVAGVIKVRRGHVLHAKGQVGDAVHDPGAAAVAEHVVFRVRGKPRVAGPVVGQHQREGPLDREEARDRGRVKQPVGVAEVVRARGQVGLIVRRPGRVPRGGVDGGDGRGRVGRARDHLGDEREDDDVAGAEPAAVEERREARDGDLFVQLDADDVREEARVVAAGEALRRRAALAQVRLDDVHGRFRGG